MTSIPSDPAMLYSLVNMKLRDEYSDIDDLCASLGIEREELERRLAAAGFEYDPEQRRFR